LAQKAAELIRSNAWRQDPTLGVGKPSGYDGATTNRSLNLSISEGKRKRLRSNTTEDWFITNRRRKVDDRVVSLGVPLPRARHDRTVPATYADWDDADIDKIRFAFWARLGQPDLAPLMDLLKAEFPGERDAYIAAIKARRTRITREREEHKKALKEKRRKSLENARDLAAKMRKLPDAIKLYEDLLKELEKGQYKLVNWGDQIQYGQFDDEDDKEKKQKQAYSAKAENLRLRVLRQTQALIFYFRALKKRAEDRLGRYVQASHALETNEEEFDDAYDELVGTRDANVHEIADEIADQLSGTLGGGSLNGKTLRRWATHFRDHRVIEFDMRGLNRPEHFLDDEDVKTRVQEWMIDKAAMCGEKVLSVNAMQHYINNELLPELMDEKDEDGEYRFRSLVTKRLARSDGSVQVARSTAHVWMKRLGADREWFKGGGFYTDLHENEEVIAYRREYLKRVTELELRVEAWHIVPVEKFRKIRSGVDSKTGVVEDIKIDAPLFFTYDANGAVIPARDPEAGRDGGGSGRRGGGDDGGGDGGHGPRGGRLGGVGPEGRPRGARPDPPGGERDPRRVPRRHVCRPP